MSAGRLCKVDEECQMGTAGIGNSCDSSCSYEWRPFGVLVWEVVMMVSETGIVLRLRG